MISAAEAKQTMCEAIEAAQADAGLDQRILMNEFKNNLLYGIEKRIKEDSKAGKSKFFWARNLFRQQLKQIPFTPEADSGTSKIVDHFDEVKSILSEAGFEVIVKRDINLHNSDNVYIKWA